MDDNEVDEWRKGCGGERRSVPDVVRFGREEFPLKSALPNERLAELEFVADDKIVGN